MPWKTKEAEREYRKKFRAEHNEEVNRRQRNTKRKWKYGLTPEGYNLLFETQQGRCKICGVHQSELKRPLGVDHNHKTGEIRGLLCYNCNKSLGLFHDNINSLENAVKYLKGE